MMQVGQLSALHQDSMLQLVLKLVGFGHFAYVAPVCKQWTAAYRRVKHVRKRGERRFHCTHTFLSSAAASVSRLQYAVETGLQLASKPPQCWPTRYQLSRHASKEVLLWA